jgi:hypothetical protein
MSSRRMFWLILVALGCFLSWGAARATEPTSFTILSSADKQPPQAGLQNEIRMRVNGDETLDPRTIQLRLDGSLLGVEPRLQPDTRTLTFSLTRNDTNRDLWARLLGAPFGHDETRPVMVGLEIGGKPMVFSRDQTQDNQAAGASMNLVSYSAPRMTVGIILTVLVIGATVLMCRLTTMMRDSIIPQVRRVERPYSLGRFQMAVWFCLILASFAFILAVTDDLNSITSESFILLGISGATALGSVAVDRTKDDAISRLEGVLTGIGLKSREDVDRLFNEVSIKSTGAAAANTTFPGAALPGNANPTLSDLWQAYLAVIAPYKSSGFWKDLVNDINGPTIHRWQILIWTLVLGGVYMRRVYANLETPTLGTNLLTLMGISGGVYLGFKIPERQS